MMSAMSNSNCVLLLGSPFSPTHLDVFQCVMFPAYCMGDSCRFEDMKGGGGSRADSAVSFHRKMKARFLVVTLVAVVLLGLVLFLGLFFGLRSGDTHTYRRAAVATDAGPCSIVGRYRSLPRLS